MKISRNWLQQFVDLSDISSEEFVRLFNIRTAEIEGSEDMTKLWEHIVVGEIKTIAPHPNADRLQVTQTDIGGKVVQIVCGAKNIYEGMKVVVALPKAKVRWHGEGELVELKDAELRGVKSFGMICAAEEVGLSAEFRVQSAELNSELSTQHSELKPGVVDLSPLKAKPGILLADALGKNDTVIEIDNKSLTHRPDLWGHYGIARECATIWERKLQPLTIYKGKFPQTEVNVEVKAPELCPRYMAVSLEVKQITDGQGIANMLGNIGHGSHGLIVDLTNYVMHELGQPLHAFDADKVKGTISVRKAHDKEKIITLDGVERILDNNMLVIADDEKAIAIAGVVGGQGSQITPDTKRIILESANFDPTSIRTTAQKLGLRTDAVQRYEKSLDPYLSEISLLRFLCLLKNNADILITSKVTDVFSRKPKKITFSVNPVRIAERIGTKVSPTFMTATLKSLGFGVTKKSKTQLALTVPSFRATKDISSEADIIEEIARFHGYEKIQPLLPKVGLALPVHEPWHELEKRIKNFFAQSCRLNEVYHYSFYGDKEVRKFQLADPHEQLQNSLSQEHTHLRVSLLPGMIEGLVKNLTEHERIAVFELGKVFLPQDSNLPEERAKIGILFSSTQTETPFYEVKSYVENLLQVLNIDSDVQAMENDKRLYVQNGRAARLTAKNKKENKELGEIYELSGAIRSTYKINQRVAYAELDFEHILSLEKPMERAFRILPKFPSKLFDVSVILGKEVAVGPLMTEIQKRHPLITSVDLFDTFTGEIIGKDKKALAFKIELQAPDRTLTDSDMHDAQKNIFDYLTREREGIIRGL